MPKLVLVSRLVTRITFWNPSTDALKLYQLFLKEMTVYGIPQNIKSNQNKRQMQKSFCPLMVVFIVTRLEITDLPPCNSLSLQKRTGKGWEGAAGGKSSAGIANGRVILSNLSKVIYDPTSCSLSGSTIGIVWSSGSKDALPPLCTDT